MSRKNQTLVEEVAAVGVALDADGGNTGVVIKWGLHPDAIQATKGGRVMRSTLFTEPKRLEEPRVGNDAVDTSAARQRLEEPHVGNNVVDTSVARERLEEPRVGNNTVDTSAAMRLELSRDFNPAVDNSAVDPSTDEKTVDDIIVFSAIGELPLWNLPGVNRDGLSVDSVPHVIRYELEEYMQLFQTQYDADTESDDDSNLDIILAPADWESEWTLTTSGKGFKAGGGSKLNTNKLAVQPKYFPDWFDPSDDEDDSIETQSMSDEEEILGLVSEYGLTVTESSEDEQVQAAIIESWKDPKARRLGAERRAGPSALKLNTLIVEVTSETEENPDSPKAQGSASAPNNGRPSKGKGVDFGERGPEYDRTGQSQAGRPIETGADKKKGKARENHLKPEHFKRDQSEIPGGGWFHATTVEPDGPPTPPASSSSSSSESESSSDENSDDESSSTSASSDSSSSSSLSPSARRRRRTPLAKRRAAKKEHKKLKKALSSIKIKAPFIYEGKADLDLFDHWTYETDTWAEWNGISDTMTVKIMVNFMGGKASRFFMKHVAMRQKEWTVKSVYEGLFNYCFPPDFKLQLRERLMAATQGTSKVRDFMRDIEALAIRFPDVTERQLKQIFWRGIHQDLRLHLIGKGLDPERNTLKKLSKYTARQESVQEAFNREQRLAANQGQPKPWGQKKGTNQGQTNFKSGTENSNQNQGKPGNKPGSASGKNPGKNDHKPKQGDIPIK
ncbi:hypothetical protein B0H13DRAFT_2322505 [Mycena leptocephala]|nr:hypothetical protein B0H13DRAFT_2322505 [Mycena leptocephala]